MTEPVSNRNFRHILARLLWILALLAVLSFHVPARAADHRDAPTTDAFPEGDITDVFAFLDPNNSNNIVLIMNVNPFSVPSALPGYRFSPDFLYQFKIDNTGDYVEDLVVQIQFVGTGAVQTVNVYGPIVPSVTGFPSNAPSGNPTVTGSTGTMLTDASGQIKVFTGQVDDPFVFDVAQLNRILAGSQDVFRGFTSPALGALRGRPVRADGTSGVDSFGGFNVSTIAIEFPKSLIAPSKGSKVNIWATVSRPLVEYSIGPMSPLSMIYTQFERMGQQAISTVFVPAAMKDDFNFGVPANDVAAYSSLLPDALTSNDTTGNTIAARASLLKAIGVTSLPNGAPLLLPSGITNTDKNLVREALLPDVLRLDLSLLPGAVLPGAAASSPADPVFAIGAFGLQNGRRPADDVVDILLRIARELADVIFPAGSGLPGAGTAGSRAGLDCSALPCPDRRVLAVLQGTDFIKPDSQVPDVSTSGNAPPGDQALSTTFPFQGVANPLPGDPGTIPFPAQQSAPASVADVRVGASGQ